MTNVTLSGDQFIFFVLLLKLGVMAALASALVTSSFFKRLLFLDVRDTKQNWQFSLILGVLLAAGTAGRVLVGYEGMDVSLSGTFLVGLLGGMVPGSAVGFFVSLPAGLHGEWAAVPFAVLCGLIGGLIRARTADRDEFWDFSPNIINNFIRSARTLARERRIDSRSVIMASLVALEALRLLLAERLVPGAIFAFHPDRFWITLCAWLTTLACVGIPLKIWNNTRVEALLEEQRRAAMQARFDALRSQINPHFLFNTLNAATSLIWSEPEKARWILVKLSTILRRLLRAGEDFVPLAGEIDFIDDYLSIEIARFGAEKLSVEKELDPRSLDVPVPSMILQPLVENAVRHGISPRVGGGVVRIEASSDGERLTIAVRDNGIGFRETGREGIGLRNVRERLKTAYGAGASLEIKSAPGEGTSAIIVMPVGREPRGK